MDFSTHGGEFQLTLHTLISFVRLRHPTREVPTMTAELPLRLTMPRLASTLPLPSLPDSSILGLPHFHMARPPRRTENASVPDKVEHTEPKPPSADSNL